MSSVELLESTGRESSSTGKTTVSRYVLLTIAGIYITVSLYFMFSTRSRLVALETAQRTSVQNIMFREMGDERQMLSIEANVEALTQRLEMTENDLRGRIGTRTAELQRQQQALAKHVSVDVASVRTELGATKIDIAATRADLETTKSKLDRAVGDLTGQGTLIARTRDELEELRRRGERNYYEFTLRKGASPTRVSTISLQLKRVNAKKNKFTLNVISDDRTIEKKDRGVAEPLQFYTGRDRLLYEVVIFTAEKNIVEGYLSTPKSLTTTSRNSVPGDEN